MINGFVFNPVKLNLKTALIYKFEEFYNFF